MSPPVIGTPRLLLRRFDGIRADEPGFMLQLLNEPSFLRHIGDRGVRTLEAARDYIAMGPLQSYQRHGFGMHMVELAATGQSVGVCGLVKRDFLPEPDLGYALLPAYCGNGYAAEAAGAVLADARESLRLHRILAITDPDNTASIALLLKLGFEFESMLQLTPGEKHLRLYASQGNG